MIVAYFCLLSQAFPLPLLNVTLLPFGAFALEEKQRFVDFYQLWLFLFLVQSTFKGSAVNTCTLILYKPWQMQLSARFRQVHERTSVAPAALGRPW